MFQSNEKYAEKFVETQIEFQEKCREVLKIGNEIRKMQRSTKKRIEIHGKCREGFKKLEMKFLNCREVPKNMNEQ